VRTGKAAGKPANRKICGPAPAWGKPADRRFADQSPHTDRRFAERSPNGGRYDIWILVAAALIFFVAIKTHQYHTLDLKGEIADYETVLWNTLHDRPLQMRETSLSFLSEHFSPVLFLLVPLYACFRTPLALLAAHGVVCALALIPLYFLVKAYTGRRWPPVLVCLAYLFSRTVTKGLLYDFHHEIFYPLFFFCAFLAGVRKKWPIYYLVLVLCASVKEDAFVAIGGLGLFLLFSKDRGDRLHGLATAALAAAGMIAVLYCAMPFFRLSSAGGAYKFAGYWGGYGSSPGEMAMNFVNPLRQAEIFFTPQKTLSMLTLFLSFAFLPFATLRGLAFLVGPNFFILFSSNIDSLFNLSMYYGLLITPFLFYASILGMRSIAAKWPSRRDIVLTALAALLLCGHIADSRLFKFCRPSYWRENPRYRTAVEIAQTIPCGAAVSAQINLLAYAPPHPERVQFTNNLGRAEYLFLDLRGDTWPLSKNDYDAFVGEKRKSAAWELICERDDFLLFRKLTAGQALTSAGEDTGR